MQALRAHSLEKEIPLILESIECPVATESLCVVRVAVASVNPIDQLVCSATIPWPTPLPFTAGYDFSGTLEALPVGYNGELKVGDRVCAVNWGQGHHGTASAEETVGGAFANYIALPISKLSVIPAGVALDVAAALPLVGTTAHQCLFACGKLAAGQRVLILGGSTAVGQVALQLCALRGITAITTTSARNVDFVSTLGPHRVINYSETEWSELAEMKDLDCVFDTVGTPGEFAKAKLALKETGVFVTIAAHDAGYDPSAHPPLSYAAFYCLCSAPAVVSELLQLVAEGKLAVKIDERFPFTAEGCRALFTKIAAGKSVGKNVLEVVAN